jgi:hypothetical protein
VKDRLIQTRVPERIESVLKEEAQKRRLTVSHLIRNIIEDTFELVDNVVAGAGDIAKDSAVLAEQVAQDAGKIVATVRGAARDAKKMVATVRGTAEHGGNAGIDLETSKFTHVLAWNQVIANRLVECGACGKQIPRGGVAHAGLSSDPRAAPAWLCPDCLSRL